MFDFPNSPINGTQATGSGGQVYTFDGTKWVATAGAGGVSSWNTRTGAVTMSSGDVTTALTYTPYNATNPSGYQTAAQVTTALAPYAPLASPTFTGTPSLPTGATGITQTAGTSNTSLATTAFVGSALTSFAPLASPVFTGDARAVTAAYGDNDTSVSTTAFVQSAVAPAANNVGRNLVTNGTFVIAQRGAGPWAAGGYTLDRWWLALGGSDTASMVQQPLIDSDRAQIGNETAAYSLQINYTGASGGSININNGIEDVRRLASKTVTVSFWARANVAGRQLGVLLIQRMGTGGTPSSDVAVGSVTAVPITTAFQRYSVTITLPSLAGKTLGTNGDSHTMLRIMFSDSTIGIQTAIAAVWGVQLELGTQATPLDAGGTPQMILAECQRFYQTSASQWMYIGNQVSGQSFGQSWLYPVKMRANPTVAFSNISYTNAASLTLYLAYMEGFSAYATASGNGAASFQFSITASADL